MSINGKGPFNFVLDTGVGLFLITDPTLNEHLNPSARTIKISGIGEGDEMTANIHPATKIALANSINGVIPVAILKEDPFNLSSFVGMPIHGLIGYELFSSFKIKINYSTKTITYYRNNIRYIPKKGTKIPISIEDRKPYVEAELKLPEGKRETVKLIIDTGAGHPLSLETNNGEPYTIPEKNIQANLGVGLSGAIHGFISRIPRMYFGKYKLDSIICAFPDYSHAAAKIFTVNRNGNLGNEVLKRFNTVFDYSNETLYLKPNYMFKEPFEHDMSGIEISTYGKDFEGIIIARVEAGSAAEEAGLSINDRILSVNFKKSKDLGIEEINKLFRSKEKGIVLEVQPANSQEKKYVLLKLKRRI
ncbi:MAG: PDZ domain-containing protein [Sphingobacteriaceae bacterium]